LVQQRGRGTQRSQISEHKEIAEIRGDQEIPQAAGRQRQVFRNTFFGKQSKMKKTGPCPECLFSKKSISEDAFSTSRLQGYLQICDIPYDTL